MCSVNEIIARSHLGSATAAVAADDDQIEGMLTLLDDKRRRKAKELVRVLAVDMPFSHTCVRRLSARNMFHFLTLAYSPKRSTVLVLFVLHVGQVKWKMSQRIERTSDCVSISFCPLAIFKKLTARDIDADGSGTLNT